jgi:hypothetical protein
MKRLTLEGYKCSREKKMYCKWSIICSSALHQTFSKCNLWNTFVLRFNARPGDVLGMPLRGSSFIVGWINASKFSKAASLSEMQTSEIIYASKDMNFRHFVVELENLKLGKFAKRRDE